MRTIKFRAWDTEENKYLYSGKQDFICTTHKNGLGVTIPYANVDGNPYTDEECFDWADADLITGRYELEQFTGLYDKNGKEIYEGDIVKMPNWRVFPRTEIVKYYKAGFEPFQQGCPECWSANGDEVEIIGNIHENKELLK